MKKFKLHFNKILNYFKLDYLLCIVSLQIFIYSSAEVTMVASPRMLLLLLVTLHLQPHYSKYYLVETDGKAASVHKKLMGSPEHIVSAHRTSKTRTKTGKTLRRKKAHSHPSTSRGTKKSSKSKYYSGSHRKDVKFCRIWI